MKKSALVLALAMFSPLVSAADWPNQLVLDKVQFQLLAKQAVNTQSALLSVNINATLSNADVVKARADIMKNLNEIAKGEWQITQFDRSQDSSGLEKLYISAQVRILQTNLPDIYKNAKAVSKPGTSYEVTAVEFKPSLEEIQQVKMQLRERLYGQINDEVGRLNKVYTNQNYSVNQVVFTEGEAPMPLVQNQMKALAAAQPSSAPPLTVSNELIMGVQVELASNRVEGNSVANH